MYPFTHGKYCGAYWSNGKLQSSVCGGERGIDELDEACREHDCSFASGKDARTANRKFLERLGKVPGIKARIAELAIKSTNYGEPRLRGMPGLRSPVKGDSEIINKARPLVAPKVDVDYMSANIPWAPLPARINRRKRASIDVGNRVVAVTAPTVASDRVNAVAPVATAKVAPIPVSSVVATDRPISIIAKPSELYSHNTRMATKAAKRFIKKEVLKDERKQRGKMSGRRSTISKSTSFAPSAKASVIENQGPSTSYGATGNVRIKHRENLGEVTLSAGTFTVLPSYSINPGMSGTFPWLSTLAQRFDKYRIHSLRFYYESEAATSSTGSVMMAFDYNATDANPPNKVAMMSYKGAVKTVPWLDAACTFDPSQMDHDHYLRNGVVPSSQDVKTYDPAIFFVATTNTASSGTIGDLWVEYDVTLKDPSESGTLGARWGAGGTISNAAVFGTYASAASVGGAIPGTWSGNTFTFNQTNTYLVVGFVTGTLTVLTNSTGTCTIVNGTVAGDGASKAIVYTTVDALAGQTLIYSSPTGTVTAATWWFSPINRSAA